MARKRTSIREYVFAFEGIQMLWQNRSRIVRIRIYSTIFLRQLTVSLCGPIKSRKEKKNHSMTCKRIFEKEKNNANFVLR